MTTINIRQIPGTWVVRSGGAVLGESARVLEVSEGDNAPVQFFPREDIAMAMLDRSDKTEDHATMGRLHYFDIVNMSSVNKNAAWSVETPNDTYAEIKDYLVFGKIDSLKVEEL
ncbi:DUF427 domain-containing protein [Epibacterium ulvae]|uniref:DUF427 domain-containing protein n=1 Tax=Epibacterium ulvae TaxID=1156985 RepID=UPI0024934595|nr:DUF427 domain-containing protein [Epibacterium ulvae]